MPSGRRAFLTSVGAAATGLAGCLDGGESSRSPTRTPTASPSDTAAPDAVALGDSVSIDGVTVTVSDLVTAHSVRYLSAPDAMDVLPTSDDQFVFVDVSAGGSGTTPSSHRFGLVADATPYGSGIEYIGPARVDAPVTGRQYGASNPDGFLGFRVPAPLDAESVAVVLGGDGPERTDMQPDPDDVAARWSVPPAAVTPLRSPPPVFAASVDVPASVPATEPIPVTLDVRNEGDGPGVFRAAINHQGPQYGATGIDRSLAAGESITHEVTVDYYRDDDTTPGRVQFAVVGPDLSEFFEVGLDGGGTPAGTGTATGGSR
ncbi:hypothetical protein ACOZ4L_05395 [Haloplanus ruber]|uniref:Uncharacterized protein n=1 Tax=Haloplanus ruber TaxID=869892 RepID=A0ABD6D1D7_9EURY|nr:hypothetical protein [Haloplanus ruber]